MSQVNIAVSTQTAAAEGNLTKLESKIEALEAAMKDTGVASVRAANAAEDSFSALEKELKQNETALKRLSIGSKEFDAQKMKVDQLRKAVAGAKSELAGSVAEQSGAADMVDQFTSAITGTVATIMSVGTIAASLRQDLENIQKKRENERLAEVDFGAALGARTIGNLAPEERAAVKPLALDVADELGLNPGAIVEAIGELRSSGAESILEATDYLKEAVKAFPQDLASARSIARAALIESAATGNRNAAQVIGGTVQAQSVSLTKNPEEFAKAFGSNIASAVSIHKQTPERAREEAAIFTLLETRGAEVAADAQRSFMTQISNFVPKEEKTLKAGGVTKLDPADVAKFIGGSFSDRQAMLESNSELRKQFFDGLQETGRSAIMRRLQPTAEDAQIIQGVQKNITTDDAAAKLLRDQQQQAGVAAAFAIAQGQRQAQKATSEIRSDSKEKLTAELELTQESIKERTGTGIGGTAKGMFEEFGSYVEQFFGGETRGQVLENTVRFKAETTDDPFIKQQLERIESLKAQIAALDAMNQVGDRNLAAMMAKPAGEDANRGVAEQQKQAPLQQKEIVATSEIIERTTDENESEKITVDESGDRNRAVMMAAKPVGEDANRGVAVQKKPEPSPQEEIGRRASVIARTTDENQDGKITGDEAGSLIGMYQSQGLMSDKTANAIKHADVEKKGYITEEQLRNAIIDSGGVTALLAELRELKEAVKAQTPQSPPAPAPVPVTVRVQAPATRPKEAPIPERIQP